VLKCSLVKPFGALFEFMGAILQTTISLQGRNLQIACCELGFIESYFFVISGRVVFYIKVMPLIVCNELRFLMEVGP
jgi:hypothetical protein